MKKGFGERIANLRMEKGVSQSEVAGYIGLTVGAYQKYEYGMREAGYETIVKLADFYDVTTDYLLGRELQTDPLSQLDLSPLEKRYINGYLKLNNSTRSDIMDYLYNTVEQVREDEGSENNPK